MQNTSKKIDEYINDLCTMQTDIVLSIYAQLMYIINLLCRSEQYRDDVHQGLYRCRARNRLGTILSRLVRVNAGKQLFIGSIFPCLYYHLFFCNFFTSIFPTYVIIFGLITFKIALQKNVGLGYQVNIRRRKSILDLVHLCVLQHFQNTAILL